MSYICSVGSLVLAEAKLHSVYIFLFTNIFGHMSRRHPCLT